MEDGEVQLLAVHQTGRGSNEHRKKKLKTRHYTPPTGADRFAPPIPGRAPPPKLADIKSFSDTKSASGSGGGSAKGSSSSSSSSGAAKSSSKTKSFKEVVAARVKQQLQPLFAARKLSRDEFKLLASVATKKYVRKREEMSSGGAKRQQVAIHHGLPTVLTSNNKVELADMVMEILRAWGKA
jgi:hypothetical protein